MYCRIKKKKRQVQKRAERLMALANEEDSDEKDERQENLEDY